MKTCVGPCGRTLEESEFNRDRKNADGLQTFCKDCNAARARNRRLNAGRAASQALPDLYANNRVARVSTLLHTLNCLDDVVGNVLAEIPAMTDQELDESLRVTFAVQHGAFIIRGAILCEKRARAQRLLGGRGREDTEGVGLDAVARDVAREYGHGTSTMVMDARIFEAFRDDFILPAESPAEGASEAGHTPEPSVTLNPMPHPREVYVIALSAGERRREALELYEANQHQPAFTMAVFQQMVKQMNQGVATENLQEVYPLKGVVLDKPANDALLWLMDEWHCSRADAIGRALVHEQDRTRQEQTA